MSDAFEAIFDNTQAEATPAPLPTETPPVEAPPIAEEAAPAPAAEVAPEATPEPAPVAQERGDKIVPLAALLDERDKRKALEARIAEMEAQRPQQQTEIPDPYDDPNGYAAYVQSYAQQQSLAVKIDISEAVAKRDHGDEAVEAAKEWALERSAQDPSFKQNLISAALPIDWAVRQHQQARDLELYSKDPVAFARSILERNGQPPVTDAMPGAMSGMGQQPPATPPRPAPPRSIASAPSGGGSAREVSVGPMAAVESLFNR